MEAKQKFASINLNKLDSKQKEALMRFKTMSNNFKSEDKQLMMKIDDALDKVIDKLKQSNPDAIKGAKKPQSTATQKSQSSKTKKTQKASASKTTPSSSSGKRTLMAVAKEIRKQGESWSDAMNRAKDVFEKEKQQTNAVIKTQTDKLLAFIKRKKELEGLSGTTVRKDAKIEAMPKGRRVSRKGWKNQYGESSGGRVYYENRDNRSDRLAPNFADKVYLENGGSASSLKAGVYRVGKPIRVSPHLYEQKIVEVFDNGDIATASDYGRKLDDFSKLKDYPMISKEQLESMYMYGGDFFANGGGVGDDRMYNFFKDDLEKLEQAIMTDDNEEVEKFFSYWNQHLESLKTPTNNRMYNFLKDDLEKLEQAIRTDDNEEVEKFFSYWNQHIKSLNYANGGGVGYKDAISEFNKELLEHPMVIKASEHYGKTTEEIVKTLQSRLSTKGNREGKTKEINIDFTDKDSGIVIKHKKKYANGGSLSSKTTYIPNRDVKELHVVLKGELLKLSGDDVVDGVYAKNTSLKTAKPKKTTATASKAKAIASAITIYKKLEKIAKDTDSDLGLEVADVQSLLDAGFVEKDIIAIYEGYTPKFVNADTEFGKTTTGLNSSYAKYQKTNVDEIIENANNNMFEIGIKYPDFDWKAIAKKFNIDLTPKYKIIDLGEFQYKYEYYLGKGIIIGHQIADKRKNDKNWRADFYTEYGTIDLSKPNAYQDEREIKAGFNGGYWGIVVRKKEDAYYVIDTLLKQADGYAKDIEVFTNGLGGVGAREATGESFEAGGSLVGIAETPLAHAPLPHYTGLVGETGAMASGEMFAKGGKIGEGKILIKYDVKDPQGYYNSMLYYYFDLEGNFVRSVGDFGKSIPQVNISEKEFKKRYKENIINKEYKVEFKNGTSVPTYSLKKAKEYSVAYSKHGFEQGGSLVDGYLTDPNFGDFQNMMFGHGGEINSKNVRNAKRIKIKNWYTKTYPTDELGEEINPNVTLWELWSYMSNGYNVYDVLGVSDSVVRERVFEKLSETLGVEYDVVYKKWLSSYSYELGGDTGLPAGAEQQFANYYLGEGASAGMFAKGGSIENQYEGKSAQEVWNMLSTSQKYHFLNDHSKEIESTPASIEKASKTTYKFLPIKFKTAFKKHVSEGQYANGGKTKNTPSMRQLTIQQIASMTGTREFAIDAFANEHRLSDSELSNLMTGMGRGLISRSDFSIALSGDKNNSKQKEIVAFAKSDKAYKMNDGGQVWSGKVDYKKASELLMEHKPKLMYVHGNFVMSEGGRGLSGGDLREKYKGYGDSMDIKSLIWTVTHAPFDEAKRNIEKFTKGEYTLVKGGYGGESHFLKPTKKMAEGGRIKSALMRDRKYKNYSEDHEVRYSKGKPNRKGYGFEDGGLIDGLNPKSFTLEQIDQKLLDKDIFLQWLRKGDSNTSADKRQLLWSGGRSNTSTQWKKVKDMKLTISDSGFMELSKGSENLYLNLIVYDVDGYDPMELQIYTKDNHEGLKQFARQIIEKFEDGGQMPSNNTSNYNKFGDENSRLVNFDVDDLDMFETQQYENFSKSMSKAEALQVLINNVEGDYTQLSDELADIAEEQYPSDEFYEDTREYKNGGILLDDVNIEVYKGFRGLTAENYFDDINGYDWNVVTMKRYSGALVSTARAGKSIKSKNEAELFSYDWDSPTITLVSSKPTRLTEKVVEKQHREALEIFKEKMEEGNFAKGGRLKSALARDRKYKNYSEDHEVRYSKGKAHRKGYGFEDGGNINEKMSFDEFTETLRQYEIEGGFGKTIEKGFTMYYLPNNHPLLGRKFNHTNKRKAYKEYVDMVDNMNKKYFDGGQMPSCNTSKHRND